MTDKFTIRDILVYSILGLTTLLFFYLHFPVEAELIIKRTKDYSDLTILILVPICYLLGHLLMGIDDFIFNNIFFRPLKGVRLTGKKYFFRSYNFLVFGNRNLGIRKSENIDDQLFLNACDKLLEKHKDKYDKAEYYQVISDLFKGVFLLLLVSIFLKALDGKVSIVEMILLVLVWYRGRIFSSYYVRFIKREMGRP